MKIGKIMSVTTEYEATCEGTKRRIDITIQEVTYIMGIATERIEIKCTMHDLVAMDPKEVRKFKYERPSKWSPVKDPKKY